MPIIRIDQDGTISIERGREEEKKQERDERAIITPCVPLDQIKPDGHIIERKRQEERVAIINILGKS